MGDHRSCNTIEKRPGRQFPTGITVLGVSLEGSNAQITTLGSDVRVSTRLGKQFQAPMRGFEQPTAVNAVGGTLNDLNSEIVGDVPTPDVDYIRVQIDFPNGLYTQSGGGGPVSTPAIFEVRWRPRTESPVDWNGAPSVTLNAPQPPSGRQGAFSIETTLPPTPGQSLQRPATGSPGWDGWDVLVRRISSAGPSGGQQVTVDEAVFRRLRFGLRAGLSYPRRALVGVEQRGTERFSNQTPRYKVPGKHRTLRVWDEALGVSEIEYFELPPEGDPYHGIWSHAPGRNVAWQVVDALTSDYGIGPFLGGPGADADDFIDWPAFRNLADYCDQDDEEGNALHECFYPHDQGQEAWEAMLAMLRTARAVLMPIGSKISVRYHYRDAHGRGTNVVGARERVDVVGTSNCEDFTKTYLPVHENPTLYVGQL